MPWFAREFCTRITMITAKTATNGGLFDNIEPIVVIIFNTKYWEVAESFYHEWPPQFSSQQSPSVSTRRVYCYVTSNRSEQQHKYTTINRRWAI
eukprot:scaffold57240_cov36-Cyclotella_meneghiniana.AAC.1